ncbi:uncharacterized protein LOC126808711 [Patella vulgata]|uniref:uncharacterized protein LOC126808711 n=1 Tax=Patella vulgata TaxID=6465 RepID=UPI00218018AB|nr:uncharacterized protein LOC126808711 [Patella vulgata]
MFCLYWIMLLSVVEEVWGRARLVEPPMRSSLWREGISNVHINYDDNHVNCGGFDYQWKTAQGSCGACGDPLYGPYKHVYPGKHATGIALRHISKGDVLNVTVFVDMNQMGYFQFNFCPQTDLYSFVDLGLCFSKNPLTVWETNSSRYYVGSAGGLLSLHLILPDALQCENCVLQWVYVTGYRTGNDIQSCRECLGCGPQETYINCADFAVHATSPQIAESPTLVLNPGGLLSGGPSNPTPHTEAIANPGTNSSAFQSETVINSTVNSTLALEPLLRLKSIASMTPIVSQTTESNSTIETPVTTNSTSQQLESSNKTSNTYNYSGSANSGVTDKLPSVQKKENTSAPPIQIESRLTSVTPPSETKPTGTSRGTPESINSTSGLIVKSSLATPASKQSGMSPEISKKENSVTRPVLESSPSSNYVHAGVEKKALLSSLASPVPTNVNALEKTPSEVDNRTPSGNDTGGTTVSSNSQHGSAVLNEHANVPGFSAINIDVHKEVCQANSTSLVCEPPERSVWCRNNCRTNRECPKVDCRCACVFGDGRKYPIAPNPVTIVVRSTTLTKKDMVPKVPCYKPKPHWLMITGIRSYCSDHCPGTACSIYCRRSLC